jgi:hypothetical protein
MDKTYIGQRNEDGSLTVYTKYDGSSQSLRKLDPRFDLRNHSPGGFECGYNGSGPAQLALAICADTLMDDEKAQNVYQYFKRSTIASLSQDADWELTEAQVLEILNV